MTSEPIRFEARDGLSIEGAIDTPSSLGGVAVLCHPHPKMGGTMNAPLLAALKDRLVESGWAVLRFNFRGIGSSEGESTAGADEVNDALGALDEADERFDSVPLVIAGWSFGGAVAIRAACSDERVRAVALIAPAVEPKPGITQGAPPPGEVKLGVPALVVCGANDDQVDPAACRTWTQAVPGARYVEVPGANHFFWAKYDQLADMIVTFFAESVSGQS